MQEHKSQNLNAAIQAIQQRWGHNSITTGKHFQPKHTALSTGIIELDSLLAGGLVVGRINALHGKPTSGVTTIAYHALAALHRDGYEAVFIDPNQTLDATAMAHCGANPDRLLIIHPDSVSTTLELIRQICLTRCVPLVVLDLLNQTNSFNLHRLTPYLRESHTTLLLLHASRSIHRDIDVHIACQQWLYQGDNIDDNITGCHITATLHKHPTCASGTSTQFIIHFGGR